MISELVAFSHIIIRARFGTTRIETQELDFELFDVELRNRLVRHIRSVQVILDGRIYPLSIALPQYSSQGP
jgi:hypothetical protein